MSRERLLAGSPGAGKVAVGGGKLGATAGGRRQRPRAPKGPSLRFQLMGERPRAIDLAEGGQGLDFVGKESDDAWLAEAEGDGCVGERTQMGVRGLVGIERQRDESQHGRQLRSVREVDGLL